MSLSSFCIEQRERETQRLKFFLAFSFVGSALLHGSLLALGSIIPWEQALEPEAEPIEITMVEPTELQDNPKDEPEKKEETDLEIASSSSEGTSVLSGVGGDGSFGLPSIALPGGSSAGGGSPGTPSAQLPQETNPRPSSLAEPAPTSRSLERADTPQASIPAKPEVLPQSIPQPVLPPVAALKPEPERETLTRQTSKPEPEVAQSPTVEPKPQSLPSPEVKVPPSPTQNEESKPEERQEIAQDSKPAPSPAPIPQVTRSQSPVTTAVAPSSQENKPAQSEKPVESFIDRLRNLGRQSPNPGVEESKVAANSSSNSQGESQARNSGSDRRFAKSR